jgi:hypothetical protein
MTSFLVKHGQIWSNMVKSGQTWSEKYGQKEHGQKTWSEHCQNMLSLMRKNHQRVGSFHISPKRSV